MLNEKYHEMKKWLREFEKGLKTSIRKFRGETDRRRWSDEKSLSANWDARTQKLATLVKPGASVIEFGAGRRVLEKLLPASCTYTPSDLVDRGDGTIVCDLNGATLPPFPPHDVALFSGVLEYINNVPRLIAHLSHCVGVIVTSYAATDTHPTNRRARGWMNDFSSAELIGIFAQAGFTCIQSEIWQSHVICVFEIKEKASTPRTTPSLRRHREGTGA